MRQMKRMTLDVWAYKPIGSRTIGADILDVVATNMRDVFPNLWGFVEPFTTQASPDNYGDATELWAEYAERPGAILMGSCDEYNAYVVVCFSAPPARMFNHFSFRFGAMPIEGDRLEDYLSTFSGVARIVDGEFGRLCLEDEWESKNVIKNYQDADGSINPWAVFCQDIENGLPGLYWSTYFGKKVWKLLGSADGVARWSLRDINSGVLALRSPDPANWKNEAGADGELMNALRHDWFFDIQKPLNEIKRRLTSTEL